MADGLSQVIFIFLGGHFGFEFFSDISSIGIRVVKKSNLIFIPWVLFAISIFWSWAESEVGMWSFIDVVIIENVRNVGFHLFLGDYAVFKVHSAISQTVRHQVLDWQIWNRSDFEMEVSDDIVFLLAFTDTFEDWRNVRDVILIGFFFIAIYWWFGEGKRIDADIFVVFIQTAEGLVEEDSGAIFYFNSAESFDDSEGDHGQFVRFYIEQILIMVFFLFDPIIDDNHLPELSFWVAGPDIDGHF